MIVFRDAQTRVVCDWGHELLPADQHCGNGSAWVEVGPPREGLPELHACPEHAALALRGELPPTYPKDMQT